MLNRFCHILHTSHCIAKMQALYLGGGMVARNDTVQVCMTMPLGPSTLHIGNANSHANKIAKTQGKWKIAAMTSPVQAWVAWVPTKHQWVCNQFQFQKDITPIQESWLWQPLSYWLSQALTPLQIKVLFGECGVHPGPRLPCEGNPSPEHIQSPLAIGSRGFHLLHLHFHF